MKNNAQMEREKHVVNPHVKDKMRIIRIMGGQGDEVLKEIEDISDYFLEKQLEDLILMRYKKNRHHQ